LNAYKVYTRLDGKLACWEVQAGDPDQATLMVCRELVHAGLTTKHAILAVVK